MWNVIKRKQAWVLFLYFYKRTESMYYLLKKTVDACTYYRFYLH